jgi:nitroreductase/FMN reductase (NADPH)/FMN reductase [NAD(P)H]
MNEILESLYSRKSVRVFLPKPIAADDKLAILLAAVQAPSAGNQQLYTILDITDQKRKDALALTCDNQPFIASAPLVLVFCADAQKWFDSYQAEGLAPRLPGTGDLMLSVTDACIAAQNAAVAAWSMGIGSCYIGDVMERCEQHRALLNLPLYVFPAAMLVFGYPTEQQLARKKPSRPTLEHIVHENGYRHMDAAELAATFGRDAGEKPYREWLRAFCERKYNSDFAREMSRSVDAYLAAFQEKAQG